MRIQTFKLGQLQANAYLLVDGSQALIIDPADEASFLLEEISRQNLTLSGMLATHGHFDHVMAAGEIQLSLPIPLHLHKDDMFLVKRLSSTAKHFLGYEPIVIQPTLFAPLLTGAMRIGQFDIHVLETPGHTPGGCSFYFEDEQAVFTGDTLFAGSVGRTDLSYSSAHDLAISLQNLFELPEETVVYSGHGEETTIMVEKDHFAKM